LPSLGKPAVNAKGVQLQLRVMGKGVEFIVGVTCATASFRTELTSCFPLCFCVIWSIVLQLLCLSVRSDNHFLHWHFVAATPHFSIRVGSGAAGRTSSAVVPSHIETTLNLDRVWKSPRMLGTNLISMNKMSENGKLVWRCVSWNLSALESPSFSFFSQTAMRSINSWKWMGIEINYAEEIHKWLHGDIWIYDTIDF